MEVRVRARLAVLVSVVCLSLFAFGDEWKKDYKTGAAPQLRLSVDDASVQVHAGAGDTISARVVTQGYKIGPGEVTVTERQSGDDVSITVKVPHYKINFGFSRMIRVELTIPAATKATIESGDGSLHAFDLHGPLDLRTGDGSIEVSNYEGALRARTGDGPVRVSGRFDQLEVETGDGSVQVDAKKGSRVSADWRVRTGDGSVHLALPGDLAAAIDVSTGDGGIHNTGLNLANTSQGEHWLRGTLNGGGARIVVHTGDGSVSLNKS